MLALTQIFSWRVRFIIDCKDIIWHILVQTLGHYFFSNDKYLAVVIFLNTNLHRNVLINAQLNLFVSFCFVGRDHTNDQEMLSTVLMHVCNHVVRAR